MKDVFILAALVLVVAGIVFYLVRQRKKGVKCIGCPYSKHCSGNCKSEKE